jgi:hypothetical protein
MKDTNAPVAGRDSVIGIKEAYAAVILSIQNAENVSWNRFYNFLMGSSILVLAWATLYSSSQSSFATTSVLATMCTIGIALGPMWANMGARARSHVEANFDAGRSVDEDPTLWDPNVPARFRPFLIVDELRKSAPLYSQNRFILTGVPWAFSALNAVMLVATFARHCLL